MSSINWLSFAVVVLFLCAVLEFARRGILEIKYTILWLITCVVMMVLSLQTTWIEWLSNITGVHYAPSLLFLVAFLFSLVLIFDLTRRISNINHKVVSLSQEHAILLEKVEKLTKEEGN